MFTPPTGQFIVTPLQTAAEANGWYLPPPKPQTIEPISEEWQQDEEKQKLFGIELAKNSNAFQAALVIFPDNTNKALWISWHWVSSAITIASRDLYKQAVDVSANLLDKDAFSVKLLKLADEKNDRGQFTNDAQDRIKALELYAKVRGFVGTAVVDASVNTTNNNVMEIILVKSPEKEQHKLVELSPVETYEAPELGVELELVKTA